MLSAARVDFYETTLVDIHANLIAHPVAQGHLSCVNVKVGQTLLQATQDVVLKFFNPAVTISGQEFVRLFAVFNDSKATQQVKRIALGDLRHAGSYVNVRNAQIIEVGHENMIGLYKETDGSSGLLIDGLFISHFMLKKGSVPDMLGTIAFALCAIQAFLTGIAKIELIAAGGEGFNPIYYGYKVWPKFGFDAAIEPNEFRACKAPQLIGCKTVLDALAVDPAAWAAHGSQRVMSFDLTPGSRSWAQLIKYLSSNGF